MTRTCPPRWTGGVAGDEGAVRRHLRRADPGRVGEDLRGERRLRGPGALPAEAPDHPHNRLRGTFTEVAGVVQPAPSPRFESTPGSIRRPPPNPGQHGDEALADWGLTEPEIAELRSPGAIR